MMRFSLSRRSVGLGSVIAALIFGGCSILNPPPGFVPFSSDAGKFSISMPGTPTGVSSDVDTPAGRLSLHTFGIQTQPGSYYAVAYGDYPDPVNTSASATILDGLRDGDIKNTRGTLTSSDTITLGNYPGIKFVFEQPDSSLVAQENLFLVGKRLYRVMIIMTKAAYSDSDAQKFLTTFKINP